MAENLRAPEPPEASLNALRESLSVLAQRGQFSARGLRRARAEQVSASAPHEVLALSLADAARGALDGARPTGWRYLLEVENEVVAAAETRSDEGGRHLFAQVNDGPFVPGTVDALAAAEKAADEEERPVTFRLLDVPALYLMALWLQPDGGEGAADSRFIPIAPAPSGLEAGRVYESDEFASRLSELAKGVPEVSAADETGG